MFYQIFISPQVKQIMIISNKHGIYEFPHELPNDLRSSEIRKCQEGLKSSYNYSLVPSLLPKMEILSIVAKTIQKLKLNFSRSVLFLTNTKVCLIYFGQDCLWKQYFVSNSPQSPSNLICFTILVILRFLT